MTEQFIVDNKLKAEIEKIVSRYDRKPAALLPVLHLVQKRFGHLTPEIETQVGELLDVPVVHVHEVVTFYTMFKRKPIGRHHIQVCSNMSCSLLGGEVLMEYLSQKLGVKPGETTDDGKFTLESVECLCACEIAPMLQWNEGFVGPLTKEKIDELIDKAK